MPLAPGATHTMSAMSADSDARTTARADKRELILDAAIHVFARSGYHGARVSDIASEAGIAYGLVYHYFKNKEEILHSIFEERWAGFLDTVEEIGGRSTTAEAKLRAVAELILEAWRRRPEWIKVLVLEIQRSSRFAEPGQLRAVGRFFEAVARILRSGQQSGELRDDLDPVVACYVFIGALELVITGLVLNLLEIDGSASPRRADDGRVANAVVDLFLNGLAAGGAR